MSTYSDRVIATAALLGANPVYYDYGHPERASARMYWTIHDNDGRVSYGHTRAACALNWLYRKGIKPPPRPE